jgi:hypothetical protein
LNLSIFKLCPDYKEGQKSNDAKENAQGIGGDGSGLQTTSAFAKGCAEVGSPIDDAINKLLVKFRSEPL